ncbi:MAG: hypothetical protein APR54_01795 [Candidatus Cloacimonas sp. SDB]|nr:MAG: hypothetical protein APR54_01795 [Candidatus Cloacimonas sp. SDB]
MSDKNKAILIGICTDNRIHEEKKASLQELQKLADTAGVETVGRRIQNRESPDKRFYAGKGFLAEIIREMSEKNAGLLIFDNELSPSQGRNIEQEFEISVTDRTEVILKIFQEHAQTKEARLQVRLAELQYQLPRLKRLWGHLDRVKGQATGSSGTARGMGEKQIEVDKRLIRIEISRLKREIAKIYRQKETQRKQREKIRKVCLVGYTNAGKSTLFNQLTQAGVLVEDKLFATLDTTTRKLELDKGRDMIISDTVGFIANLPHHLVASFRATLKDVVDADLLLHVVDASDENFSKNRQEVLQVLEQIGADEIDQVLILNKMDITDKVILNSLLKTYPDSITVSAARGEKMEELLETIDARLHEARKRVLFIPHQKQRILSHLYELGKIVEMEYEEKGVKITAVLNKEDLPEFEKYIISPGLKSDSK